MPCSPGGLGLQGPGGRGPGLFVPCSSRQPGLASEPQMAPGCGRSLSGEVGRYRVSAGSHSPGALVLGTAQRQEGARGQLCQACLRLGEQRCPGPASRAGLGVLSQSQEMDLLCEGGGAAALGSWGEPQPPARQRQRSVGAWPHASLPWPGLDLTRAWKRG